MLLFVILVAWGLKDEELYWSEVGWYAGFCVVSSAVMMLIGLATIIIVVPFVIVDIILIAKLMGFNPSVT